MHRILGLTSSLCFCLSLAVHITSVMGIALLELAPLVMALHVLLFAHIIPMGVMSGRFSNPTPKLSELREQYPFWVVGVGFCLFAYAIANYGIFMVTSEGGSPDIKNGEYILHSHGTLIRVLDLQEFTALKANVLRGFSGHWLIGYFVPIAYFLFRHPSDSIETTPVD